MNREFVRSCIDEIGIIPGLRVHSPEDALFAADAVQTGGIPIVEVTMTVPGALEVISSLARTHPEMIVGAGTVLDVDLARRCLEAGAHFLTGTGFDPGVVALAIERNVCVLPGALTPSEVMAAWKAGPDFVKVFPCGPMGGENYIRILKAPFPHVPLIAAGGVNHGNVEDFILAGAAGVGIGGHLIPMKAIELKQWHRITELARRFVMLVKEARGRKRYAAPREEAKTDQQV
jgi:2-dehydro-3-deoxyphosphogluconate aldolase/(4S)-4-hydroxy-2-oxoglutarate aldolase